jgi:hypothetical protein
MKKINFLFFSILFIVYIIFKKRGVELLFISQDYKAFFKALLF